MQLNNEISRYDLLRKRASSICEAAGFSVGDLERCTPYELILESRIDTDAVDRIMFRVSSLSEPVFSTEIRLHPQDMFFFDQWALYMLNAEALNDMSFTEHTFPDGKYFNTQEAVWGNIFYNGNLSLYVNNLIVISNVRTDRFRIFESERERRAKGMSAMCDMEQVVILSGAKNNCFFIDLPGRISFLGSDTRLRLRLKGLLCTGLEKIIYKKVYEGR